ncbi:MAG: hypothetical protein ACI8X5_004182 [Planctomycetota bacterium]|jgi:hypothetical protein
MKRSILILASLGLLLSAASPQTCDWRVLKKSIAAHCQTGANWISCPVDPEMPGYNCCDHWHTTKTYSEGSATGTTTGKTFDQTVQLPHDYLDQSCNGNGPCSNSAIVACTHTYGSDVLKSCP